MNENLIAALGAELHAALESRVPVEPLTARYPKIAIGDAYRIQQHMVGRRLDAGERIIGKKIGVTSEPVMKMLGVYQPDFGMLTSGMVFRDGDAIKASSLIQPKAEGEIAFILGRDLTGPGITPTDVLDATETVRACFEIVDSRIRDWKIKIEDTVADNASCGVLVLGERAVDPRSIDMIDCAMTLEQNGSVVAKGRGAAALGNPLNAVAWLANTLGELGMGLHAGDIILSGSLAAMVPASAGDSFRVDIAGLGGCSVRFV